METEHFTTFFTVLIFSTVSRSEDHVFVQTGGSVKLDTENKTLPQFNKFIWINDKSQVVVRFSKDKGDIRYHSSFTDRVELNSETFFLTLKNMQKNDSGIYTAKTQGNKETTIANHKVSVIDPVDSPVLERNIIISRNSCIVNVSCKTHALQLNTSYNNNCSQKEVTSSRIETLTLYCIENVVVCNYSNPVSWRKATLEINQLCKPCEVTAFHPTEDPKENNNPFPLLWLLVIAGVLVLVFTAVSVIYCFHKKPKKGDQQEELTIYAQVKPKNLAKKPLEMLEKSTNSQTVYGFTGDPKEPRNTSQTMNSPEIRTRTQPENASNTIYSTIGQNQIPKETDQTIYSAVSKPSRGRKHVH